MNFQGAVQNSISHPSNTPLPHASNVSRPEVVRPSSAPDSQVARPSSAPYSQVARPSSTPDSHVAQQTLVTHVTRPATTPDAQPSCSWQDHPVAAGSFKSRENPRKQGRNLEQASSIELSKDETKKPNGKLCICISTIFFKLQ